MKSTFPQEFLRSWNRGASRALRRPWYRCWRWHPYLTSAGSSVTSTSVLQLARGLMDSSTGGTTKLLLTGSQSPWPKLKVDLQCKSFHWGTPWAAETKQKKGAPPPFPSRTFSHSPTQLSPLHSPRHNVGQLCPDLDGHFFTPLII